MSTEITIAGEIESALTHFAGLGVATILEAAGLEEPLLHWTGEARPRLHVQVPGASEEDVAEAMARHAESMASEDSWVQARIDHEGRAGTGLFSPRIKASTSQESWEHLAQRRREMIDSLLEDGDRLSLDMIGALGEPAYWRFDATGRECRPDQGASRWEMKARNRGEEFVGDRLSKMARAVADREPGEILSGIRGETMRDELDGKRGSQTATGLQRPGPADAALAWAGLWGIAMLPVVPDAHRMSPTPGAFPQTWQWPVLMCLPIVERATTLARLTSLLESAALARVGEVMTSRDAQATTSDAAERQWLRQHGVVALAAFPVERWGSDSAPQRIVLDGRDEPLESESVI